jgi:hypothetical protein
MATVQVSDTEELVALAYPDHPSQLLQLVRRSAQAAHLSLIRQNTSQVGAFLRFSYHICARVVLARHQTSVLTIIREFQSVVGLSVGDFLGVGAEQLALLRGTGAEGLEEGIRKVALTDGTTLWAGGRRLEVGRSQDSSVSCRV